MLLGRKTRLYGTSASAVISVNVPYDSGIYFRCKRHDGGPRGGNSELGGEREAIDQTFLKARVYICKTCNKITLNINVTC